MINPINQKVGKELICEWNAITKRGEHTEQLYNRFA